VERGADLTARSDTSGETPLEWAVNASRLEWARKSTHDDIIAYLTSAMQAKGLA
jgi:ankyrin repeat protein